MNMTQRAGQMLKQWGILFVLLILLHGGLFLGWAALESSAMRSPALVMGLMVVYLILFGVIGWVFYQRVNVAAWPPEYREAEEQGLDATAKVLDIKRTRWRIKRSRNLRLKSRPLRYEYQMRVRVMREGAADYEASLAEFLPGSEVPDTGDVIPVRVHPERPEVIVMVRGKKAVVRG